jgi:hypothetical protein
MQQEAQVKSGLGYLDRFGRVPQVRLGAVVAIALAAAFVVWLVLRNDDGASTVNSPATASATAIPKTAGVGPVAQSFQDLQRFAAAGRRPVYWAGPLAGYRYELTQTRNSRVFVRYLPPNVAVGVNKPLLTIATYPFPKAFEALKALAKDQGGAIELDHGGLALVDRTYPKSIHLAYPGVDYQVEVFSPSPRRTREVVVAGQVAPIR